MKKLIAILLSVLMLCSVIPFAAVSVSAEEGITIVVEPEAYEFDAGDEFEVTVYLQDNPGVISADVSLLFDTDALEVAGEWEEGIFYPYIESPRQWKGPFTYGPDGTCTVQYTDGTATANVTKEEYFTVVFKVKDDAYTGDYDLTVKYNPNNYFAMGFAPVAIVDVQEPTIHINGQDPEPSCEHEYDNACDVDCNLCGETREVEHNVVAVEAKDATCTELGNIAYWYCDVCGQAWLDEACTQNTNLMAVKLPMVDHEYFYACDPVCMNCYEITNPDAAHSLSHVEAKDATCFENGNIEYWTCEHCGGCWDNEAATGMPLNQMMVVVPMAHDELTHVEAKAPTCFENGNIEYWTCEACGYAWLDAEGTLSTNLMAVVLPMAHGELTHVEAVAPTCFENGNIEYWYCEACGYAWLDAEGTLNTNLMAVVLPMGHGEITHVEAKDATCTELGNIEYWYCEACGQAWLDEACTLNTNMMAVKLPMVDHTYDNAHDADCNVCGEIREIVLGADEIILFGGNSVTEIKGGLAFLFNAAVDGIVYDEEYYADYTNATVTIDGVEYKLVKMGAIMNNKGYADQSLDNVDDKYVLNVEAAKVFGDYSYAIRIINIPEAHLDTEITARPYFVYENLAGEQITVYGEDQIASYNGVLNG